MNITKFIHSLNNVAISNGLDVRFRLYEFHIEYNKWLCFIIRTNSNIRVTFIAGFDVKLLSYTLHYRNVYLWEEDCEDTNNNVILDTIRAIQLAIGKGLDIGMEEL